MQEYDNTWFICCSNVDEYKHVSSHMVHMKFTIKSSMFFHSHWIKSTMPCQINVQCIRCSIANKYYLYSSFVSSRVYNSSKESYAVRQNRVSFRMLNTVANIYSTLTCICRVSSRLCSLHPQY